MKVLSDGKGPAHSHSRITSPHQMPLGDQIKGDEMGKACSTYGAENSTMGSGEGI
jgi:hypothetical protein